MNAPTIDPSGAANGDLSQLLQLERMGENTWFASPSVGFFKNAGNIFGGLIFGQAIMAGGATVERPLHMITGRFARGGQTDLGITFEVSGQRDGGSFSSRHLRALQEGRVIAEFDASYQAEEPGLDYQEPWAETPPAPESLPTLFQAAEGFSHLNKSTLRGLARPRGIEVRSVNPKALFVPRAECSVRLWVKVSVDLSTRPDMWAGGIGHLVDYMMAGAGISRHTAVFDPGLFGTTLSHTLWLHRIVDPSQWLLHDITSHWTGGGRTLNLSRVYTRDGVLVATNAQEALLRRRTPKPETAAR